MKKQFPIKQAGLLVFAFFLIQTAFGQSRAAMEHLQKNAARYGLVQADVSDVSLSNEYQSKHNGVTHTWLQQQYKGIPIFNALIGLHSTKDGQVYSVGHRFVHNAAAKANTGLPSLAAHRAVDLVAAHLGFKGFTTPSLKAKADAQNYLFEGGAISRSDIPVSACYVPINDGQELRLAWMVVVDQANTADVWSIRVDAQTGEILDKNNRTVYCQHHKEGLSNHDAKSCLRSGVAPILKQKTEKTQGAASSYRVFALPTESPAHGDHELISDPENLNASPFGWHDTDGMPGAEFTIPRGNNVFAYEDTGDSNAPPANPGPDGGAGLIFDFPMNQSAEPAVNVNAAIVNLFYMNNMMHDIFYNYGFDEAAGNFQQNNYGNGGLGTDFVRAEALDGGGVNNANFATPPDGSNPRMQMYTWTNGAGEVITVNSPGSVIGTYSAGIPTWGAGVTNVAVTGDVVLADDGTGQGSMGCGDASIDYAGKIVLIDRGVCEFGRKALNAQNAGAIGCIICNYEDSDFGMGPGAVGLQVSIPALSVKKSTCDLWKSALGNGLNMSFVLPTVTGPDELDGDFDNGIIAHEYGHGISNRLTGGGNNTDCLGNAEQMGEGWSDWFTLVTTVFDGDEGTDRRGVGTYVERQPNDGQGIRRYPYSTDMNINPVTYGTVAENTGVHAVGEIWAAVTWDLYWAMVEKHGWSDDILNGTAGNNRAIQLVMDGMKMQPCSPGFLDGRDAILLADVINYNGEDTCLIHEVFARRGMGYLADQGSTDNAADGQEHFEPMPTCIKELKISKLATDFVEPGGEVTVTLTITNHKDDAATGVVVTDELPLGLIYASGSASNGGSFANGMVSWDLGTMAPGEVQTLTYKAIASVNQASVRTFANGMEDLDWFPITLEGDAFWFDEDVDKKEGTASKYVTAPNSESEAYLEYFPQIQVTGSHPVLRFWTKYNTEAGSDAGFVEISTDDGFEWQRFAPGEDIRNGYSGAVQYGTLAIPFLQGFSGQADWQQSYFDLSRFNGQDIKIRYRFGTNDGTGGQGWWLDYTELIDLVSYNSEAKVTSAEGDEASDIIPNNGIFVNTDNTSSVKESYSQIALQVRPNPVKDILSVAFGETMSNGVSLQLFDANGRLVKSQQSRFVQAGDVLQLDMTALPSGIYQLRAVGNGGVTVETVIKG